MMNDGWNAFVQETLQFNDRSNTRLLNAVRLSKGEEFVADVRALMKTARSEHGLLRVVKEPVGMKQSSTKHGSITEMWLNQRSTSSGIRGAIYIQVKPARWLKITYSA
ncbi:hypothetical protein [Hymenobacter guriensis]|uniref:Uncharacterized protein n=1 Tax=Hymenobacter guriensis TaxID=2793065 RepID=A0ABS0KWT2_9BACT|nr:hypothetical protein [Hymenobacter guriensis]MBG8552325.1 hypothetical protein [Hymenobacter guriensis]